MWGSTQHAIFIVTWFHRNQRLLLHDAFEMNVGRVTAPALRLLWIHYFYGDRPYMEGLHHGLRDEQLQLASLAIRASLKILVRNQRLLLHDIYQLG